MPVIDLTDEELQGFVHLCATASGPGVSWMLTNSLLTKARLAQERSQGAQALAPHTPGIRLGLDGKLPDSEGLDAAVPRAT